MCSLSLTVRIDQTATLRNLELVGVRPIDQSVGGWNSPLFLDPKERFLTVDTIAHTVRHR